MPSYAADYNPLGCVVKKFVDLCNHELQENLHKLLRTWLNCLDFLAVKNIYKENIWETDMF